MRIKPVFLVVALFFGTGVYFFFLHRDEEKTSPSRSSPSPVVRPESGFIDLLKTSRFHSPSRLETAEYITGYFQGWEEVQDSPDKYLLLADFQTKQLLPKARVLSESHSLYGRKTLFLLVLDKDNGSQTVTLSLVEKTIDPKDEIRVFLRKQAGEKGNLRDENGSLLAEQVWLIKGR